MRQITTAEELDALPDEVLLEASGTYLSGGTFTNCWVRPIPAVITGMAGEDQGRVWEVLVYASPEMITTDCIRSARVLYRLDQPTATQPLREAIVDALCSNTHAPMETHHQVTGECLVCPWPVHATGPDNIADAVLALIPGRSEAEVKAEALREFRVRLAERLQGEWSEAFNDNDLLAWIDRIAGGEQ